MAKYEEYQGQIFDAVKSKKLDGKVISTRFNIVDKLSPVTERNDVPFITTFAPYSVYLATILESGESVEANITLDDFYELKAKTITANDIVFRTQSGLMSFSRKQNSECECGHSGKANPAFTVVLAMGEHKGKAPGDIILNASDKKTAIDSLKKHAEFCENNVAKYPNNQKYIDAINAAISLYELDLLESEKGICTDRTPEDNGFAEFNLHDPVDKYYSKKVQKIGSDEYTKCYKYKVSVRPTNSYPYHVEITNYWAPIGHTQSGLTPIQTAKKQKEVRKTFDMTMSQWTSLIEKLSMNTESCHRLFYSEMRKRDDSYSFHNQM